MGERLVLAALRLSLKANEAERPRPHPHPRSWLKLLPAPQPKTWLIPVCSSVCAPGLAGRCPLLGSQRQLPWGTESPTSWSIPSSLRSGAWLRQCSMTDCPLAAPAGPWHMQQQGLWLHSHTTNTVTGLPMELSPLRGRAPSGETSLSPAGSREGQLAPSLRFLALEPAVPDLDW